VEDAQVLAANLLRAYGYSDSLAELHSFVPPITLEVGERPLASGVARLQARDGDRVTNLRHERVTMDGFDRFLLMRLDGSHDRSTLVDQVMAGPVAEGVLSLKPDAVAPSDGSGGGGAGEPAGGDNIRDVLVVEIDKRLGSLARAGLLVAR
jgi:hypothetical protein